MVVLLEEEENTIVNAIASRDHVPSARSTHKESAV